MRKKLLLSAALLVVTLFIFVACGGAEPTATPVMETPPAEPGAVDEDALLTPESADETSAEDVADIEIEEDEMETPPAEPGTVDEDALLTPESADETSAEDVADIEVEPDPRSIAEIAAENEEFSTLATALEAAGLDEILSDAEAQFTVFAPTDEAFEALPEGTLDELLADPEGALTDVLLFHVADGLLTAEDLVELEQFPTLTEDLVTVSVTNSVVYLNEDVQVVTADIPASNGVIHAIDTVMLPPSMEMAAPADDEEEEMAAEPTLTLAETLANNEEFSTLLTAVETAGLEEVLANPDANLTVFAPDNEAFEALPEGLLDELLNDPEGVLTTVLLYHVVGDSLMTADVYSADGLTTLQGETITVNPDGEFLYLNDGILVSLENFVATNGVVHVVDRVLIPPTMQVVEDSEVEPDITESTSEAPLTITEVLAANSNFSTLLAVLDETGLSETLSEEGEFTLFAPTDDAFAELPEGTVELFLEDPEGDLTDILLYHLADEPLSIEAALEMDSIFTMQGEALTFQNSNRGVILNETVTVPVTNVDATNGVIHIIDDVLLPPSFPQLESEEAPMAMVGEVTEYEIPGEAVYPEGVAYDSESHGFFTGSTEDGTIYRGGIATEEVVVFAAGGTDGRTAAIGMAVDEANRRLWVAGGATQRVYLFNIDNGEQIASFQPPEAESSFINDVIVDSDGNAYFTDSFRPELFVVRDIDGEVGELESFLDLSDTVVPYDASFNVNGIVVTPDDQYLILNHSGASALFRVDIESGEVIQIETDEPVGGDGMVLDGTTLYSVQGEIYQVELSDDYSSGEVVQTFSDESFIRPTTIAKYGNRLLVVNSQFNNRSGGTPELPFTITDMPIPKVRKTIPNAVSHH